MKKGLLQHTFWHLLLLAFIGLSVNSVLAQDDDEMPPGDDVPCKPESFDTEYDQFKSDSVTTQQVQIWYSFGQEEFKHEQWKRAIPYYWKVLMNDGVGTYKVVYSKLAKCYFELTKSETDQKTAYLDSTLLIVYKGLEKHPQYAGLHFRAGSIHRTLGRTTCAIPHYEALTSISKDQVSYWKTLAQLYFTNRDERCLEIQKKVIDMKPNDPAERDLLARMMAAFGMDPFVAQVTTFRQDPTNIDNALAVGKEAYNRGEYGLADSALTAVLGAQPQNIEALEFHARTYESLDRKNDAIAQYRKILAIDPKSAKTHCAIAMVLVDQGKFSSARSNVYQAQRIDPNFGQSYMVMAYIYEEAVSHCQSKRSGKELSYDDKLIYEKAGAEYRKAGRVDPNFKTRADSRNTNLRPFYRTKEDKHLYNYRENVKDACYSWIK